MDGTKDLFVNFEAEIQDELERMEREGDGCGRGCTCARPRAVEAARQRLLGAAKQQGS